MESAYKDCYLITKVIKSEDSFILDLPFQTFHQSIYKDNRDITYSLDEKLVGQEVFAYVRVKKDEDVSKFTGYLGDSWEKIKGKIDKFWAIKKEDGFAVTSELGVTTKYSGVDKNDLMCIHPKLEKKNEKI